MESKDPFSEWPGSRTYLYYGVPEMDEWRKKWEPVIQIWREKAEKWDKSEAGQGEQILRQVTEEVIKKVWMPRAKSEAKMLYYQARLEKVANWYFEANDLLWSPRDIRELVAEKLKELREILRLQEDQEVEG